MKIIFLGPPGAGKGTQAQILSRKFKIPHLSIGQLLRLEYEKKTKDGLRGEKYWGERGINVPTVISFAILKKYLHKPNGFILDNFPRTISNLNALTQYLSKNKMKIDFVFHLKVDKNESCARLRKRGQEDEKKLGFKRIDEKEALIKIRWQEGYLKDISLILSYFKNAGVLHNLDGKKSIEKVNKNIIDIINNKKPK